MKRTARRPRTATAAPMAIPTIAPLESGSDLLLLLAAAVLLPPTVESSVTVSPFTVLTIGSTLRSDEYVTITHEVGVWLGVVLSTVSVVVGVSEDEVDVDEGGGAAVELGSVEGLGVEEDEGGGVELETGVLLVEEDGGCDDDGCVVDTDVMDDEGGVTIGGVDEEGVTGVGPIGFVDCR